MAAWALISVFAYVAGVAMLMPRIAEAIADLFPNRVAGHSVMLGITVLAPTLILLSGAPT